MSNMADRDIARYWVQFLRSLPLGCAYPPTYHEAFRFGFGPAKGAASEIAALVLAGTKTSTASVEWVYRAEGKCPPKPGDLSIVLDGHDRPVCVIETIEVKSVCYDEMGDEQFAHESGEGDRSLESWQRMYWELILSECTRLKREPTPRTRLVCERFRVVYKEPFEMGA